MDEDLIEDEVRKENSLIESILHVGVGTIISLIIGFFTTPIITRIFSPYEYGVYSLFLVYANMAMIVFSFGMDQALVRFYYENDSELYKKKIIKKCLSVPLCITALMSVTINLLSVFFDIRVSEWNNYLVLLFSIYILVLLVNRFALVVLRLDHKTKEYGIVNVFQKIFFVASVLFLAKMFGHPEVKHLCVGILISVFVATLMAIGLNRDKWTRSAKDKTISCSYRELLLYAYPLIFTLGITTLFQTMDRLFINHYYSAYEVGIYASAMSIIHILGVAQTSFTTVWMPNAVEKYSADNEERDYYVRVNEIVSVVMFLGGLGFVFMNNILVLFLGEKFRDAYQVLPFLVFSPVMYTISETTVVGLVFMKKSKYQVVAPLAACLINLIGNYILVPKVGCRGAAISTALSYIVFMLVRTMLSRHFFYVKYKMNKVMMMTVFLMGYAFFASFSDSFMGSFFIFICGLMVLAICYGSIIKEIIINIIIKKQKSH